MGLRPRLRQQWSELTVLECSQWAGSPRSADRLVSPSRLTALGRRLPSLAPRPQVRKEADR